MPDVQIIDVLVTEYYGHQHYYVVVDRMPERVYVKEGNKLTAHDGGFYDFLEIVPGSKGAFGGGEFYIKLSDGSPYRCAGQVWACGSHVAEPVASIGKKTIEKLQECYVFDGSYISKAKLDAWLAENKPSRNYHKYDRQHTIKYLDELYAKYPMDRPVSAQRARALKRRGVTIRVNPETGQRGCSPRYEKRKAEILAATALN